MSLRSLVEFNHDFASVIERDPAGFVAALLDRLRCVDYRAVPGEIVPGVTVVGARHHTEPYRVQWGVYMHCREDGVEKWSVG